jgi:hypothetical protein
MFVSLLRYRGILICDNNDDNNNNNNNNNSDEISGSHGGDCDDGSLLGHSAM